MIAMYDRSSTVTCVNDARQELFARKQKSYQSIPPTRAALVQHLKRSAYQVDVYGAKQQCASLKLLVLQIGGG